MISLAEKWCQDMSRAMRLFSPGRGIFGRTGCLAACYTFSISGAWLMLWAQVASGSCDFWSRAVGIQVGLSGQLQKEHSPVESPVETWQGWVSSSLLHLLWCVLPSQSQLAPSCTPALETPGPSCAACDVSHVLWTTGPQPIAFTVYDAEPRVDRPIGWGWPTRLGISSTQRQSLSMMMKMNRFPEHNSLWLILFLSACQQSCNSGRIPSIKK